MSDEIDEIMAAAGHWRTIWLRVNKGHLKPYEVGWSDEVEEAKVVFASADYSEAEAEMSRQESLETVRVMREALRSAGYGIMKGTMMDHAVKMLRSLDIEAWVKGYEIRLDEGDYKPTEHERFVLVEAISDLIEELLEKRAQG